MKLINFLLPKSRLTPLTEKSSTIPRLELQAAVIAVRLKRKIDPVDFEFHEILFFSDSQS